MRQQVTTYNHTYGIKSAQFQDCSGDLHFSALGSFVAFGSAGVGIASRGNIGHLFFECPFRLHCRQTCSLEFVLIDLLLDISKL